MYGEENIVCKSFVLVSLILSSCSLEYGLEEYLIDSKDYQAITSFWEYSCPHNWPIVDNYFTICFPKVLEKVDYTVCCDECLFRLDTVKSLRNLSSVPHISDCLILICHSLFIFFLISGFLVLFVLFFDCVFFDILVVINPGICNK